MKKSILKALMLTLMLSVIVFAFAACGEDKKQNPQVLEFTSNGDGTCYVSGIGTCTDADIVIPSVSPDGDKVTGIGDKAFQVCLNLKSIIIPDGVTSIGKQAFSGCHRLTSIEIPNSVTSIDNEAFANCSVLTNIIIPDGVTYIGKYAFYNCINNLTSIVIPDGVTSIGSSTFYGCSNLTSIVIPDSVTSIGITAFYECKNLENVTYNGTKEQWNKITKDEKWNHQMGMGHYVIHCTDGDINW